MSNARNALIALVFAIGPVHGAASEDFTTLLDEAWEWQLSSFPLFSSQLGDRRYNDQWTDRSLEAIEARHEQTRDFLRRVYAIDRLSLGDADQPLIEPVGIEHG